MQTLPGTPGHLQALFPQLSCMSRCGELGVFLAGIRLTSEGFVGSSPTAPTKFVQLEGFFGTLIGTSGTIVEPLVPHTGGGKGSPERVNGPPRRQTARACWRTGNEQRGGAGQLAAAAEEVEAGRGRFRRRFTRLFRDVGVA